MSRSVRVVVKGLREGLFRLDEESSRYLGKIHRKKAGDVVELFDPERGLCCPLARIVRDRLPHFELDVTALTQALSYEMPVSLFVALGKNDKPEQAIRDATAFGAVEVVLVHTDRSVAKSDGPSRVDRLMRVAEQVARQCERGRLPRILGPIPFVEAVQRNEQVPLICAFVDGARPLLSVLNEQGLSRTVNLFVGPEGGFSENELGCALENKWRPVTLGPYVLRAESAVTAVLSVARAVWVAQSTAPDASLS